MSRMTGTFRTQINHEVGDSQNLKSILQDLVTVLLIIAECRQKKKKEKENGRDLTQSYDQSPYSYRKIKNANVTTQKYKCNINIKRDFY